MIFQIKYLYYFIAFIYCFLVLKYVHITYTDGHTPNIFLESFLKLLITPMLIIVSCIFLLIGLIIISIAKLKIFLCN